MKGVEDWNVKISLLQTCSFTPKKYYLYSLPSYIVRYPNLHNYLYGPHQVAHLYDSDNMQNKVSLLNGHQVAHLYDSDNMRNKVSLLYEHKVAHIRQWN